MQCAKARQHWSWIEKQCVCKIWKCTLVLCAWALHHCGWNIFHHVWWIKQNKIDCCFSECFALWALQFWDWNQIILCADDCDYRCCCIENIKTIVLHVSAIRVITSASWPKFISIWDWIEKCQSLYCSFLFWTWYQAMCCLCIRQCAAFVVEQVNTTSCEPFRMLCIFSLAARAVFWLAMRAVFV